MQQESNAIIDRLIDEIDNSKSGWGKTKAVNADLFLENLNQLRIIIEQEAVQSNRIVTERQKILDNANATADKIIQEAREKARQLTEENQITVNANREAERILSEAKQKKNEMLSEAKIEADGISENCENECNQKKAKTNSYIESRLEETDQNIENTIDYLDQVQETLVRNLNEIRGLHKALIDANCLTLFDEGQ